MQHKNIYIGILSALVIILVIVLSFLLLKDKDDRNINSYQECVDAGYPVQESFPRRCVTPNGKSFTNPEDKSADDTDNSIDNGEEQGNTSEEKEVKIYFSENVEDPSKVQSVIRKTNRVDVGTFALEQLLAGPTEGEKLQGLSTPLSFTGDYTCRDKNELLAKDFVLNIDRNSKTAVVQLCRSVKDSGALLDSRVTVTVTETLKQFETVDKVVILDRNGNCFGDLSGLNLCKN